MLGNSHSGVVVVDMKLLRKATFRPEPQGGSPRPSVYRLPQTFNRLQCDLKLSMDSSSVSDEQSTWSDIGLAASQMLAACSQNAGLSGGWIRTGDHDHLVIEVGNLFGHRSVEATDASLSNDTIAVPVGTS